MIGFEIKTPTQSKKPKKNPTRYRFEFIMDVEKDKELIKKLESQPNRADYLRNLIRRDTE